MDKAGESETSAAIRRVRERRLRILITNDDGIHAPGFASLEKIARALSDDVWMVAPENEQSGASHSLTLAVPIRMRQVAARSFAVLGTPTDCVMMGVKHVVPKFGAEEGDARGVDLVLSGVNRGGNLADDVTYSGTIAGAMEGCVLGVPSVALSQVFGFSSDQSVRWSVAEQHGPALLARLIEAGWPRDVLLNINFPDRPPLEIEHVEITNQGKRDTHSTIIVPREDLRGVPYFWLGFQRSRAIPPQGTDLAAILDGKISVTPLHLNLTYAEAIPSLAEAIAGAPNALATES
jgi:5'-nucleotidase